MVADRRDTGENAASAPGAVAPGGRQSGDRCGAGVAEREFIKKDLRSGFDSGKLIARCQPSGDIGAESLQRKTSSLSKLFIAAHPDASRRRLSALLCEAWQWKQANGALCDMICRGLLLMLHRAGEIELPAVRQTSLNPFVRRERPQPPLIDRTPVSGSLSQLGPIELTQVRRTAQEPLFNSLIEHYHYLGYEQPVGEHLKYLVWAQGRPIACLAWSSAPRHLGSRDRYIGWSAEARRRNIRFIAYNTRFLILPWVTVPHLASYLLGRMARLLSQDWERVYGHPIYFLETFVDPERFRGTCYRAANWVMLGRTTGRGKDDHTNRPNRSIKEVLGLPVHRRFRELLQEVGSMKIPDPESVRESTSPARSWRRCWSRPNRNRCGRKAITS